MEVKKKKLRLIILHSLFRNFKMWDMLCLKLDWIWLDVWLKKVYIYFTRKESMLWNDSQLQWNFMAVVAVVVAQSLTCIRLFVTPWTAAFQASLSFTISQFAETHVHWVGDAIQPAHPLSFPSLLVLNLSQHLGLFLRVSSLHQVAKVLKLQLQHHSFQWIFRYDFL